MAYNVSDALGELKPCTVKFDDGSKLELHYRPWAYTPEHEDQVAEAEAGGRTGAFLKAWLLPLVADWDVVRNVPRTLEDGTPVLDRKGKQVFDQVPVPVDDESMSKIPLQVLGKIMLAISEGITPGEPKRTDSEGSFS